MKDLLETLFTITATFTIGFLFIFNICIAAQFSGIEYEFQAHVDRCNYKVEKNKQEKKLNRKLTFKEEWRIAVKTIH